MFSGDGDEDSSGYTPLDAGGEGGVGGEHHYIQVVVVDTLHCIKFVMFVLVVDTLHCIQVVMLAPLHPSGVDVDGGGYKTLLPVGGDGDGGGGVGGGGGCGRRRVVDTLFCFQTTLKMNNTQHTKS